MIFEFFGFNLLSQSNLCNVDLFYFNQLLKMSLIPHMPFVSQKSTYYFNNKVLEMEADLLQLKGKS